LLSSSQGRDDLASASGKALEKYPDSAFLIYLRAMPLADQGKFREAHDLVTAAIRRCQKAVANGTLSENIDRRYNRLNSVWRVIDAISRDNVAWTDGSDIDVPAAGKPEEAEAGVGGEPVHGQVGDETLVFSEQLIQKRQQEKYLQACRLEFDAAGTLQERFKAIWAMFREGLRRVPDYHAAYDMAGQCFEALRPRWIEFTERPYLNKQIDKDGFRAASVARQLAAALRIARKLRLDQDIARLEESLVYLAGRPAAVSALWTACDALVDSKPEVYARTTAELILKASRDPNREPEVRDYFNWALKAQRYDFADRLFERLSDKLRFSKGALQYLNILQQEGRFAAAATLAREIHQSLLARPAALIASVSWGLVRRTGELDFAAETAELYEKIPQPSSPQGVIFLAPRTIEQLRRYPLVVLMELKKRGWAVIPLTKGMLPLQPTGRPELDRLLGCLTLEGRLDQDAEEFVPQASGFEARVEMGRLRWNGLNLDHTLWEEAAINRRRYNVDYTCPALRHLLDRLVRWTSLHGAVLEEINRTVVQGGTRCGFMVLQQSRLPDAVVRFYLDEFGEPDEFFCIHSSNGFENYFLNFSSRISTRTALRNLTRHRQLRAAGLPVPSDFEAFYEANRARAAEFLDAAQEIMRMKRSTGGLAQRLPEAQACKDRITEWRKRGGKVACLFGKVVCDSGVPFDGGPAHRSMKDWLNHAIDSVRGSDTLLLIKPHPHEMRNEIGVFLTEYFTDLIEVELPDNAIVLGHRWLDIQDLDGLIDLGVIYSGTTAVELGVLNIPCVLSGHYAPIDYPVGHAVPKDRAHFGDMLRFAEPATVQKDIKERAAAWLHMMRGEGVSRGYRYHARQITNRVVYPPWWFRDDIERYQAQGDRNVALLADEIVATSAGAAMKKLEAAQ
jgi:hypothetical protein